MKSKIFVRGDGNAIIGTGHLMRLFTIIEQMPEKEEIKFLCADESSSEFVRQRGFQAVTLGTDYRKMEEELPILIEILSKEATPILLLDSYYVTFRYLEELRAHCRTILLDDFGENVYPVAGIINYHCYADKAWYHEHYQGSFALIGPNYLPLRQEFFEGKMASTAGNRVLLTSGGGDAKNVVGHVLERIYDKGSEFHWVIGPFSPNYERAKAFAVGKSNVILRSNVRDMASLMSSCQIGITASGNTAYEACAVGLPIIVFAMAENQERLARKLSEEKCALFGGFFHQDEQQSLLLVQEAYKRLSLSNELRNMLQTNEKLMVNGNGARQIAEKLVEYCNS